MKTPFYYSNSKDRVKELVRIRDKRTCQECKLKWKYGMRRLDVHHLDENKQSTSRLRMQHKWDFENMDRLITLCHKCHFNLAMTKRAIRAGLSHKNTGWKIGIGRRT